MSATYEPPLVEVYECQRCYWSGPERQIMSKTLIPARYDPPDPGEYVDRCPECDALDSMEQVEYKDICESCGIHKKYISKNENRGLCSECIELKECIVLKDDEQ